MKDARRVCRDSRGQIAPSGNRCYRILLQNRAITRLVIGIFIPLLIGGGSCYGSGAELRRWPSFRARVK